jgi:hypothetical protein
MAIRSNAAGTEAPVSVVRTQLTGLRPKQQPEPMRQRPKQQHLRPKQQRLRPKQRR